MCIRDRRYTKENGGKPLPALAFFHIPLLEYNEIVGAETTLGQKEEGIASPKINTGFFASLVDVYKRQFPYYA